MTDVLEVLDTLAKIGTRDLKWQIKHLKEIQEWAIKSQGFDKRAEIVKPIPISQTSGWWIYRECLTPGALGDVLEVDYMARDDGRGHWYVNFRPDEEWSVHDFLSPADRAAGRKATRYWKGIGTCPEGFTPALSRPEERGSFMLNVKYLRAVAS